MRYYMVDRITSYEPGTLAKGIKTVSLESDVLQDHFPGYPVLPGAFLIESMAQLSGFLIEMTCNTREYVRRALLVKVAEAKFHSMVEPGDCLEVEAEWGDRMEDAATTTCLVMCGTRKVATATLMFVLKEIPVPAIHEQRRALYTVWTRNCQGMSEIW